MLRNCASSWLEHIYIYIYSGVAFQVLCARAAGPCDSSSPRKTQANAASRKSSTMKSAARQLNNLSSLRVSSNQLDIVVQQVHQVPAGEVPAQQCLKCWPPACVVAKKCPSKCSLMAVKFDQRISDQKSNTFSFRVAVNQLPFYSIVSRTPWLWAVNVHHNHTHKHQCQCYGCWVVVYLWCCVFYFLKKVICIYIYFFERLCIQSTFACKHLPRPHQVTALLYRVAGKPNMWCMLQNYIANLTVLARDHLWFFTILAIYWKRDFVWFNKKPICIINRATPIVYILFVLKNHTAYYIIFDLYMLCPEMSCSASKVWSRSRIPTST